MDKDEMIGHLSRISTRIDDKLLEMMDRYGVNSLRELTREEVETFYMDKAAKPCV